MEFEEYQRLAWRYDQHQTEPGRGLTIALLGLGGEVGTLQTTQKKVVRDHEGHTDSVDSALEDLGDILWYVADAAAWLGEDLDAVAQANLRKIANRWPEHDAPLPKRRPAALVVGHRRELAPLGAARVFDGRHGAGERLPRQLEVHFAEVAGTGGRVLPVVDGEPCGNRLGDNSYDDDGYRWHDCFHLGFMAVLGWSPVMRALLKRKRRSDELVDDVEDGGRAIAIEEGISALLFEVAGRAGYFETVRTVDGEALRTISRMTSHLEVQAGTPAEWEHAILRGYDAWRQIKEQGHGAVTCDLDARTIECRPLTAAELHQHAEVAARLLEREGAEAAANAAIRECRR